jgi:hypothetical protein
MIRVRKQIDKLHVIRCICVHFFTVVGDLLSGVMGTLTAWSNMQKTQQHCNKSDADSNTTDAKDIDKTSSSAATKDVEKQEVITVRTITIVWTQCIGI